MMTKTLSRLVSASCMLVILLTPIMSLYYLVDLEAFRHLLTKSAALPIYWETVKSWQLVSVWFATLLYFLPGFFGLIFLRKAFLNFATGEFFNHLNSRALRWFSVLLMSQVILKPIHFAICSVLLSWNHPIGEKMLSLKFGTSDLKVLFIAFVLWVLSDLLVASCAIDHENKQFV